MRPRYFDALATGQSIWLYYKTVLHAPQVLGHPIDAAEDLIFRTSGDAVSRYQIASKSFASFKTGKRLCGADASNSELGLKLVGNACLKRLFGAYEHKIGAILLGVPQETLDCLFC